MQTLSMLLPPKSNSLVNVEFSLHFCHVKRKKIKGFNRNPCFSMGFTSGDYLRSSCYDLGCGFLHRYSVLMFYLVSEPKRDVFRSVPLALAFDEQGISDEVGKELLEMSDGEVVNGVHLEQVEHNELPLRYGENESSDDEQKQEDGGERDVVVSEKKSKRVDTRALAWSLRFAKTGDDVEEVMKEIGDLPLQVYSTMIKGFGKDKRVDSAIALVEWLKKKKKDSNGLLGPNRFIYNSLLGALKQAERFEQVEKIMEDMSMEGVMPNAVTYNTLIGVYLEQGRERDALNLFDEMQVKGISPSPASYSTALLAYRRLEDGFGALKFYVDFREKYQKGEIGKNDNEDWEKEAAKLEDFVVRISHQIMRKWLVRNENLTSQVLKLLTDMDRIGIKIGRAEHERLVWACTREEHHVVAKELYTRIRERDSDISLSVCNHVIWLLGKAKKWWAALEIYEDLLDKGPKPNNMSYELVVSHFNTLLAAARKKGIWRWGVSLLNKMEEKGLKPGTKEWNSVLIACSRASETSAAVEIFKRMVEKGEKPTVVSYGALLSALEKGRLYDEALQVWKHMIRVGLEPNLYAYTIMASIHAAQGKFNIVDSIIREMVTSKVDPSVVTFNAIISACAKNGMGGAAYEWFQRMKAENIDPDEITYEVTIEALANDGKPRLAYHLYMRSQDEGLTLSPKAYDAVVESSRAYGATLDVSSLGPRPMEKNKKVQSRKSLSEFYDPADVPSTEVNRLS